jgi:integrase
MEMFEPVYDLHVRDRGEAWLRNDYVFLNQESRPININTLQRWIWYAALKRAGLRARPLYQTRHTSATLMLATEEDLEWMASQMSHTSSQTLFQRDAKSVPNVSPNGTRQTFARLCAGNGLRHASTCFSPWR